MLSGTSMVGGVVEQSVCRSTKDFRFTEVGVYQIHANTLMSKIPFDESKILPDVIDSTIFINNNDTKLTISTTIKTQNYISTKYIGRAPLEFYEGNKQTEMGRQFVLVCKNGRSDFDHRYFGTEQAINGYNKNVSDTSYNPSR